MSVNFSESKTMENLMRAFSGECQARTRYTLAAESAKKKGYYFIYNIFTLTANQEKVHAGIFMEHLRKAGIPSVTISDITYPTVLSDTPEQLLDMSRSFEYEEYEELYPAFARTAREEGFPEIAFSFEKIALIEKEHGDRFGCFADLMAASRLFKGNEDTEWLCLNCGHIHKGSEVPERCPVCAEGRGYFVPYKYYLFIAEEYGLPAINMNNS